MRNKHHSVTKSNNLVIAGYKLTLNEQRLVLAAIAKIDPRKPMPRPICIDAHYFSDRYNVPVKQAYECLRDACDALYERDLKTFDGRYKSRFRWVDRVDYKSGGGEVRIYFTVHIQHYLVHIGREFITYKLDRVARLSSIHSIRLFEMLQRFRSTGFYTVGVPEFREYLELGPSYERFSNLRGKVIDPAIRELNSKSGLEVSVQLSGRGRMIERLTFRFRDTVLKAQGEELDTEEHVAESSVC